MRATQTPPIKNMISMAEMVTAAAGNSVERATWPWSRA
jgi:hypothetical protein